MSSSIHVAILGKKLQKQYCSILYLLIALSPPLKCIFLKKQEAFCQRTLEPSLCLQAVIKLFLKSVTSQTKKKALCTIFKKAMFVPKVKAWTTYSSLLFSCHLSTFFQVTQHFHHLTLPGSTLVPAYLHFHGYWEQYLLFMVEEKGTTFTNQGGFLLKGEATMCMHFFSGRKRTFSNNLPTYCYC